MSIASHSAYPVPKDGNSGMTIRQAYKMAALSCWHSEPGETPNAENVAKMAAAIANALIAEDEEYLKGNSPNAAVFAKSKYQENE